MPMSQQDELRNRAVEILSNEPKGLMYAELVRRLQMLTNENFVTPLIALCLWNQVKEHGIPGAEAIGYCLRNRVNSGWSNWLPVFCFLPHEPGLEPFQSLPLCGILSSDAVRQSIYKLINST
jgi:hypothetical protein